MATNSRTQGDFSFAKIAAMSGPPNTQPPSTSNGSDNATLAKSPPVPVPCNAEAPLPGPQPLNTIKKETASSDADVDNLRRAVQDIDINLSKDHEGTSSSLSSQENAFFKRENSFGDDHTQLSNSSTKMTNFDSKSLASVTTFAMDEKDSVRPDDSASVQAIDEEESLSGPASGAPNSVAGSEAGSRAFRDQFLRDGNSVRPRGVLPLSGGLFNGVSQRGIVAISPDSVANNFVVPAGSGDVSDDQPLHGFPLEPDEKLLEAMKSPKDRLLILQLEEKICSFIKDSNEQSLELPPSNAFGRLLAHKLGDYYHLTHFLDNNVASVRLHRTPFCRLPTPLSNIHAANNNTPPPSLPAMKIMRRTDGERPSTEGSVEASSSAPSKTPSEAGESGEGDRAGSTTGAKDRFVLSREAREAKYQEARERIFRDFPESAKSDTTSGDSNPNISRSNSTTGRKKNRQRTPHDDSFEARSQFAYYPGMPYGNGSMAYNSSVNDGYSQQVPYLIGPGMSSPTGSHMPSSQGNGMYPPHMGLNNASQYPIAMPPHMTPHGTWQTGNMTQQSPYAGYESMSSPVTMSSQSSNASSPAMNNYAIPHTNTYQQNSAWNPASFSGSYQQNQQRNQPPVPWNSYPSQPTTSNMAAYPYTQYPGQHLNHNYQNPTGYPGMQGNFARSHFNPQTRSFIPSGSPASLSRQPSRGAQLPMQSYGGVCNAPNQWTGYADTNQSRGSDHPSANSARMSSANSRDSIAKWGTPSHLPPKPPPSEVPSSFDLKHQGGPASIPGPSYHSNGIASAQGPPFVVSGGVNGSKTS